MHDLALAQRIVSMASTRASALGYPCVKRVRVRVAAWACHDADHLRNSFEFASRDTPAAGADLEIELVKPTGRCDDCGADFEPETVILKCPKCGCARVALHQTREVEIIAVEPGAFEICR